MLVRRAAFALNVFAAVTGLLMAVSPLSAQGIVGSINGTVQDPQSAVIPNAKVTLVNEAQGQGSARELNSRPDGTFVFTPVLPGLYTLTVEASGFKKYTQTGIRLNVNDRLGLPAITLEVGQTGESVTVEATAVQLETVTAERSGVITGRQMIDVAIRDRNYTSLLRTVPGVPADTAVNAGNTNINGQRANQNNFTVDGQNVTDIGVNQQFAYRINVDAIAEFKVSTNTQGAEFGRNSGAQIQTVTKSGTQEFHGNGYWFKRGEFMNANTFLNNMNRLQRPAYRYMTAGYTVGGPIYIPGKFNRNKDKLFGFLSHEWNRQFVPAPLRQITVPTEAERMGDFSNSRDQAGVIQTIYDPATRTAALPQGSPFPNAQIPATRFNEHGPSTMNWLPKPNVFGQPNYNYQSQQANEDPSYDQIYRVDYNVSEKWRMFVRHLNSKQTQTRPYGRADTSNNLGLSKFLAPTYGWSMAASVVTIINPTLTNDFQFGYAVNGIPGSGPPAGSPYLRSVSNIRIPLLYPEPGVCDCVPNFIFGGTPGINQMTAFTSVPYDNRNPIWNWTDNITKIAGSHTIKAGIYIETTDKTEQAFQPYLATINFNRDPNNPNDTNWAYSNALLGTFQQYRQTNRNLLPTYPYNNIEFYGQDTWKVNRKLTLNYGLRVNFIRPFYDQDNFMSNFEYSKYDAARAVQYFQPVGTGVNRRAQNPITGEILPSVYIGAIVPGVGDINNGIVRSGQDGTPRGLIENRGAHWGPRIGVAYQINDKTVFRAGGGAFYERTATFGLGITSRYTTNPPLVRTAELYYGNLSTIQSAGGTFFPAAINRLSTDGHVPTVYNYNAGIQRQLPGLFFIDVSYVGSQSRHLYFNMPFNRVPFGSAWEPYSQDPTVTPRFDGTTNLPVNMYRPYKGYVGGGPSIGDDFVWGGSANYNALQIALNRRRGPLVFGLAYTWSKALGVDTGHLTDTRKANYGPLGLDRTQSLSFNYIYDVPSLARRGSMLDNAVSRGVFDGWQLSGLTSFSTGAPVNVNYSLTGVSSAVLNRTITGSEDIAPRVVMTCNPNLTRDSRNIDAFIDTSCFAPAQRGSLAMDSGINRLRGPGVHQWDMSVFKKISLGSESRYLQLRLEAYNAFNHTQWGSFNSNLQFNSAGQVVNRPTQLGGTGGRLGFGALNTIRANSQRILQIAVKLYF